MGLGRTLGVSLLGLTGHVIEVEAHLAASIPGFSLVGLPDAALAESRDRVRAAVTSSAIDWPQRKITVNLSPASLRKSGSGYDTRFERRPTKSTRTYSPSRSGVA